MISLKISHWVVIAGCFTLALCQLPAGFPGGIMRVERNWYALPTDRAGTVVTRVHRDSAGAGAGGSVLYELDTHGPPAPFAINPHSGVVTVNDTLQDKENRSYSLWVIASEDGSITQKIEVVATITDITGQRPKVPQPPPFSLPKFPPGLLPQPTFSRPTPRTTAATEQYKEEDNTVPEHVTTTSTRSPPRRPDDLPLPLDGGSGRNMTSVSPPPALPHPPLPPESSELPLTVIPLIAIGALVLIVAGVILFVWKKNSGSQAKSKKEDMSKEASAITSTPDAALNMWERPRAYSNRYEAWDNNHLQISEETTISEEKQEHDEWEFPRHRLRIFNIVGEGAFGQVWRAHAIDIDGKKGELTVAVKTLKENASEKEKSDLLQELAVMKGLGTHPNVVRLLACCTSKEPTLLIMEFVSLGKLQQFLRDSRAERHYRNTHAGSQFLTSRDLTHQAFQVARGMEFLASKGIIHRDLAARNVLITEERTCKVADFGFARDVAGTHVYERKSDGRLPIRWMAPESLYDDIFSVKSDIWSFGVLLWEIVTLGSTPYPGLSAGDVMRKVRAGHRLEKPEHCRRELYNIMYYCWESDPAARPDFTEVVTMLERLLCTETDYIELERFPDHSYYNLQHLDGEKL